MNRIEKFKLAVVSDKFNDSEINQLFLNMEVESEDDIVEILNILKKYRPDILKRYENFFAKTPPT